VFCPGSVHILYWYCTVSGLKRRLRFDDGMDCERKTFKISTRTPFQFADKAALHKIHYRHGGLPAGRQCTPMCEKKTLQFIKHAEETHLQLPRTEILL